MISIHDLFDCLTLSQMTNFRLFQTERVCRQYDKFEEKGEKFYNRVENAMGNRELACYEQFLLFPKCFQKTSTCTADM